MLCVLNAPHRKIVCLLLHMVSNYWDTDASQRIFQWKFDGAHKNKMEYLGQIDAPARCNTTANGRIHTPHSRRRRRRRRKRERESVSQPVLACRLTWKAHTFAANIGDLSHITIAAAAAATAAVASDTQTHCFV